VAESYISCFLVILRSWATPFIGTRTLKALEQHVEEAISNELLHAPYCSIVQSSGTGKSRLVDEFSKSNFLIPINLRMEDDSMGTHHFPLMVYDTHFS
jgi:hypothetical protein